MTSKYHFSFLGNTVQSITPKQDNMCGFCNQACGCLYCLNECECTPQMKLCGECLDEIYDLNTTKDIIGKCPSCNKTIKTYNISE